MRRPLSDTTSSHLDAVQETYSYWPSNWLTWNVGYHNEHHDFCNIPVSLPALKKLAPEFYDNLAVCDSWVGVIWDYITRDDLAVQPRKRAVPDPARRRRDEGRDVEGEGQ